MAFNIVEAMQGPEADCAFDQPCKFGHRVEGHAVYCHNDAWSDSPRKCRRTWYTGGETRDEDCPGFQHNPEFSGKIGEPKIIVEPCVDCKGSRLIPGDRNTVETCDRCQGSGEEPHAIAVTTYQLHALENGAMHAGFMSGKTSGHADWYNVFVESDIEDKQLWALIEADLLDLRTVSYANKADVRSFLVRLTGKGMATLRAIWDARKE